jgi:mannose-6-phosphate isomerase-like protein (cupin superfamily)
LNRTLAAALALTVPAALASEDKLPMMPADSTSNEPVVFATAGLPKECRNPVVERIIRDYESGRLGFEAMPQDDTVKDKGWKTWGAGGGEADCPGGAVAKKGDYCWIWMSRPLVGGTPMGISVRFGPYDNVPHYHRQGECFYAMKGQALLNVNGAFKPFVKGQAIYIEGNAIHDLPVVKPEPFAHLWWYPNDTNWDAFQYHWRRTTKRLFDVQAAFDRVDRMRLEAGLAPKGARPVELGEK